MKTHIKKTKQHIQQSLIDGFSIHLVLETDSISSKSKSLTHSSVKEKTINC